MLSRRAMAACLLLGLVLALPALAAPLAFDDLFHVALLEGKLPASLRWWELFTFAPADPGRHELFLAGGVMPWWAAPDLKISFLRPLSSALVVVDHQLFGRWAPGWHLHSILWWLAALASVARLYRRLLPGGLALLALVLFTLDDAHWMPIVWPAARNGLVSLCFGMLGLGAHLRWREQRWRAGTALGPLCFGIGLCAGEVALAVLAYVVAYEWVGRDGQRRRRLRALAGHGLVLVVYAVVRARAGAGVAGSSSYVDPIHEPLRFAREAAGRIPALIADAVFGVPAELWGLEARARVALVVAGLLAALLVGLWLRRALAALPPEEARPVRWLGLGALLALLPGAGALIGERILLPSSVGAAVVFAALLRDGVRRWRARRRPGTALLLLAVALPNLVLAGPLLLGKQYFWKRSADSLHRGLCRAPLEGSRGRALVVWADRWTPVLFGGLARQLQCPGTTASWTLISVSPHRQVLTRTSARALVLAADPPLLDTEWELGFRAAGRPLRVGDAVTQRGGLTITVADVRDGRPTRVELRLPRPLEESEYRLLVWRKGGLEPLRLAPGESVSFGR